MIVEHRRLGRNDSIIHVIDTDDNPMTQIKVKTGNGDVFRLAEQDGVLEIQKISDGRMSITPGSGNVIWIGDSA